MSTRTKTTRVRTVAPVVPQAKSVRPAVDIRPIAIDFIDSVADISGALVERDKNAAPFCRALRNVLSTIRGCLEEQRESPDDSEGERRKVVGLLNNLERLCARPSSIRGGQQANSWPALRATKSTPGRASATECLSRYATDRTLRLRRAELIEKLSKFGARGLRKDTAEVTQKGEAVAPQKPPHAGHELDEDIENLLNTLRQYASCRADGISSDIATNIRLNGYRTLREGAGGEPGAFILENASAEFGVLFLDHPHAIDGCWQETCIQICQPPPLNAPAIRFADSIANTTLPSQRILLSSNTFCDQISSRSQDLLRLSAQDNQFHYHKRSDVTRDWLAGHDAMPLSRILTKSDIKLYDKSKAILEFLVARATWQFYMSDAIGEGLTSDSVYFVHERRSNRNGVFVNEPMLMLQNQGADERSGSSQPAIPIIHDMPKILALGILLLELETRKCMQKHRENGRLCPAGSFNVNTDYKIARNLISDGPDAHDESILCEIDPRSPLRRILPLCIKAGQLESKVSQNLSALKKVNNTSKTDVNKDNALRATIYTEIVQPLEDWANQYDDLKRVKPLYELPDALPLSGARMPPKTVAISAERFYIRKSNAQLTHEQRSRQQSRQWFNEYESLRGILQPVGTEALGEAYQRTKIAVLDTGLRQEDYDYLAEFGPVHYNDFTKPDALPRDNTGHGSASVSLLVKMCPNASLYVARVLENDVATVDHVATIVQGIDWAIAQDVDIITMAIGFEKEQPALVDAIGRAHAHGILIFSAVSNARNIGPIYCPAIITDKVFGMFSTNAGIRESSSINPSPMTDSVNLAIFGEDVEIEENSPLMTGTSLSTSIGAGLAALLVDFSRQGHMTTASNTLLVVRGRQQMKRLLLEMSSVEAGYNCIRPWSLLNSSADYINDRRSQRDWIRGTIERLMQPANLYGSHRR